MYDQLQLREIFHLEFLRWFSRKVKSGSYAVKGGVNLRFFFKSFRYSEDMDLDARGIHKDLLLDAVMRVLEAPSFQNTLKPFGIERIIPPAIAKAKQTETTQRFKAHLITFSGEDLFTKIEFSRRGFKGEITVEPVLDDVTRMYKMPPLLIPHYTISAAVGQKIDALSTRAVAQARDIFDLYILSSQYRKTGSLKITSSRLKEALEKVFGITFNNFQDTVLSYLSAEDRSVYNNPDAWDEIRLKTARFLEELSVTNG
ncbi:MAG: nucleotidyl transferase AbiEii/AbiGii toxin family protein [Candidatus Omnitrophota bacterium]